jgi:hypothetical protein
MNHQVLSSLIEGQELPVTVMKRRTESPRYTRANTNRTAIYLLTASHVAMLDCFFGLTTK